jgi:hypothetical protein
MVDTLDRQAQIARLGDALQSAAARADWDGLGEQARALIPRLRALAVRGPWNAAERAALERLRERHDVAAQRALAATRALELRLEEMRANKDGWLAYALHTDTEPDAHQE